MNHKCTICHSRLPIALFSAKSTKGRENFKFFKCSSCSTVQIRPLIAPSQVKKIYCHKNIQADFLKNNEQAKLLSAMPFFTILFNFYTSMILKRRRDIVVSRKTSGKLLDIGFGDAKFLESFNSKTWELYGIEINKDMTADAKRRLKSANLLNTNVEKANFKNNHFDIICLWHVFEHLNSPREAIKKISTWLKKDGYLIIEVPNGCSFYFKIFGKNWQQLIVPEHQFFYNKMSFVKLLEKTNLRVVNTRYLGFASFGPSASFANFLRQMAVNPTLASLFALSTYPLFMILNFFLFSKRENLQIIASKVRI